MTTYSEPQVSDSEPSTVLTQALETVAGSVGEAGTDATASSHTAAATFQSGLGKGAYYTTYGVVFTSVFLKELLPTESSLRRGFEQGVADGAKAAMSVWGRFYALPDDALVNETAPAGAAAQ